MIPGTLRLTPPVAVGSGKLETPWERMQREKLSASCWSWVWLELEPELPEELELLGEPEPHAAITVLAMIIAVAAGSLEATRDMADRVRVAGYTAGTAIVIWL